MGNYKTVTLRWFFVLASFVLVNLISQQFFIRLDFTEDRRYTLSDETEKVLSEMNEPVTVSAYFSEDLPPRLMQVRNEVHDLLVEYHEKSNGMLAYDFNDPAQDEEMERDILEMGIEHRYLMVRERDERRERRVYMGAALKTGTQSIPVPFLTQQSAIEFELTRRLKKLLNPDPPSLGIVNSSNAAGEDEIKELMDEIEHLYDVEEVSLANYEQISDKTTLFMAQPVDSVPEIHWNNLERYLGEGGNLFLAYSPAAPNLEMLEAGRSMSGTDKWLEQHGIHINPSLIIDTHCGNVDLPGREGAFQQRLRFPYFPVIFNYENHLITQQLESMFMPWTGMLAVDEAMHDQHDWQFLARSSDQAGVRELPLEIDIGHQWSMEDFTMSDIPLAAKFEGNIFGNHSSRMVVTSNGFFIQSKEGAAQSESNVNFAVNAVEWLSGYSGLLDLRTQRITSRPLRSVDDNTKLALKYGNAFLPVLLAILTGVFRYFMQLRKRRKWINTSVK